MNGPISAAGVAAFSFAFAAAPTTHVPAASVVAAAGGLSRAPLNAIVLGAAGLALLALHRSLRLLVRLDR